MLVELLVANGYLTRNFLDTLQDDSNKYNQTGSIFIRVGWRNARFRKAYRCLLYEST